MRAAALRACVAKFCICCNIPCACTVCCIRCGGRPSSVPAMPSARATHVLHRSLRHTPPVAVGVAASTCSTAKATPISTPAAARPSRASATGIRTCLPRCMRRSTASPTPTPASSPPRSAEALADHLSPTRRPDSTTSISSPAARRRSRRRSSWRASISSRSASRSARMFIARRQSYHGNTLGALAVGGNEWRRAPVRAAADGRRTHVVALLSNTATAAPSESAGGLRPARCSTSSRQTFQQLGPDTRHRLRRRDRWSAPRPAR